MDKIRSMLESPDIEMVKLGCVMLLNKYTSIDATKEYLRSIGSDGWYTPDIDKSLFNGRRPTIFFVKGPRCIVIHETFISCSYVNQLFHYPNREVYYYD